MNRCPKCGSYDLSKRVKENTDEEAMLNVVFGIDYVGFAKKIIIYRCNQCGYQVEAKE